jgi:hypothetical protein
MTWNLPITTMMAADVSVEFVVKTKLLVSREEAI